MESVYIETTVIGSIAGRLHPDIAISARQVASRNWWSTAQTRFRLLISQFVIDECSGGDPTAAQERLQVIKGLVLLDISDAVVHLANELMNQRAIPPTEPRDAVHVAIAAVHGVQYLVTWNFNHIANAALRGKIEAVCRMNGFEPPTICTPDELAGNDDADLTH